VDREGIKSRVVAVMLTTKGYSNVSEEDGITQSPDCLVSTCYWVDTVIAAAIESSFFPIKRDATSGSTGSREAIVHYR
jgi:hypothetical protein